MLSGAGRGAFSVFVGMSLFFNVNQLDGFLNYDTIMGLVMMTGGLIFIFMSRFREMSDEALLEAVSLNRAEVQK